MKLNALNKNQLKVLAAATGFAVAALVAGPAKAETDTTSFSVKINIQKVCDIKSTPATDMDFGNHLSSDINITGPSSTITLTCTPGTDYDIGLLPQNTGGDANGNGKMDGPGGNTIAYSLWQDSGATAPWGNTVGTNTLSGTGDGTAHQIKAYGKVASANAPAGSYSDTVQVTVTY